MASELLQVTRSKVTKALAPRLLSDVGVEHVAMELPLTGNLLQDEDLSVAFAAFCLLPLGCDGAVRPRANETEVTAQFDLQDVELHVEVELRESASVGRCYLLDPGGRGEGLADEDRVIGVRGSDQIQVGFVQGALVRVHKVSDFLGHGRTSFLAETESPLSPDVCRAGRLTASSLGGATTQRRRTLPRVGRATPQAQEHSAGEERSQRTERAPGFEPPIVTATLSPRRI